MRGARCGFLRIIDCRRRSRSCVVRRATSGMRTRAGRVARDDGGGGLDRLIVRTKDVSTGSLAAAAHAAAVLGPSSTKMRTAVVVDDGRRRNRSAEGDRTPRIRASLDWPAGETTMGIPILLLALLLARRPVRSMTAARRTARLVRGPLGDRLASSTLRPLSGDRTPGKNRVTSPNPW